MNSDQELLKTLPDMQEGRRLLHLATMADIPISVMTWLVNHDAIESAKDLTNLRYEDLLKFQREYQRNASPYASNWSAIVTAHLEDLIMWLLCFCRNFGRFPHPCVLTKEFYAISPKYLRRYWKEHGYQFEDVTFPTYSGSTSDTISRKSYCNL